MNNHLKIFTSILLLFFSSEATFSIDVSDYINKQEPSCSTNLNINEYIDNTENKEGYKLFGNLTKNEEIQTIKDNFVNETLDKNKLKHPNTNTKYNYNSIKRVSVKLKISDTITTKKNIEEGQIINLKIRQDVKYKKKVVFRQDTPATARIKTYMTPGMNGIPGQIVISDFEIPNIDSNKLQGTYIKRGIDLSLLVFPLKWMLTAIPPTGSLTNFIIGGNAKITENDTILLYYYPDRDTK